MCIRDRSKDNVFIPVLFHDSVIEHYRSIGVLIENELHSSASTLLRPLFEAHVKGLWFAEHAKENDFERLRNDKFEKVFRTLVSDIDPNGDGGLEKAKKKAWGPLNSLTHAGAAQLGRKYSDGKIENNHSVEFLAQVIDFAQNYALLSCCEIAGLSKNKNAMDASIALAKLKHGL